MDAEFHDKGLTHNEPPSAQLSDLDSKRTILEVVREVKTKIDMRLDENDEPMLDNTISTLFDKFFSSLTHKAGEGGNPVTFSEEVDEEELGESIGENEEEEDSNSIVVPEGVASTWKSTLDDFLKNKEKPNKASDSKYFMKVCNTPPVLLKLGIADYGKLLCNMARLCH